MHGFLEANGPVVNSPRKVLMLAPTWHLKVLPKSLEYISG